MAVCPPRSWPVEKVMGSEEFFEYQRSIAIGCPDWDYRAKIWKPLDNETGAYDKDPETGKTIVYFVLQVLQYRCLKLRALCLAPAFVLFSSRQSAHTFTRGRGSGG